jgi:predicted ester cyclase
MEEMLVQNETLSLTEQNLLAYFETHDVKYVTEDAKFKNLSTGEVHTGRAEIGAMLHFIYHVAFDAKSETKNYFFTENKAVIEGLFKGRHIGEMAGIPATNKEVSVPFCVTYDLENGLIKEARIYMLTSVMMEQLGLMPSPQNS